MVTTQSHAITYSHMYKDAVKAFGQYKDDVISGAYPEKKHSIPIKDEEFAGFMAAIKKYSPVTPEPPPGLLKKGPRGPAVDPEEEQRMRQRHQRVK